MKAVVVGIGDELLSGLVVNTNAAMIGERLLAAGIPVVWSKSVGDDEEDIVQTLREAMQEADVVISTGGLGPTHDDRTREALAALLGARLLRDEEILAGIRARFEALGRRMAEANARQADVPEGASAIPNPWGTAPGLRCEVDGALVFCLPGVPSEARRMLEASVLPEVAGPAPVSIRTREIRCVGLAESELAERLALLASADNPRMAFLPGGGEVRVRFVATAVDEAACLAELDRCEAEVRGVCGEAVYGVGTEPLESLVGSLLGQRGLTLAVAESCSAGMLASRIASVPGASDYLRGGVVAYQNEVKASQLGVAPELIEAEGPVSEEVALAMARGALERFGADVALAITCVGGPGPSEGTEAGTTFLALAAPGAETVRGLRIPGDRDQVRLFSTTFALNLLRLHLLGLPPAPGWADRGR